MEEKRNLFEKLSAKFIFSDDLKRNQSALTSVDAEEGDDDNVDDKQCKPWERNSLLKRLRTYRPGTWFGKPRAISPVTCASHGWINSAADTLTCPFCRATLVYTSSPTLHGRDSAPAAEAFILSLTSSHDSCCPWRTATTSPAALAAFPPAPSGPVCATLIQRVNSLAKLASLPAIGGKGLGKVAREDALSALLQAESVPAQAVSSETSAEGETFSFDSLQRRPHRFAQAAKVLAILGWDVQPLPGCKAPEGGLLEQNDCLLRCRTCSAEVGLWGFDPAEGTRGTLGCGGLIGTWGPGAPKAIQTLNSYTIAGGTPTDAASPLPSCPMVTPPSRFGLLTPPPAFGAKSAPVFGSASGQSAAVFGSSVSLSSSVRPSTMSVSAATSAHRPSSSIGMCMKTPTQKSGSKKRSRSESPSDSVKTPIADHLLCAAADMGVPGEQEKAITDLGLPVTNTNPLDPVLGHRAWCPWVCPEERAGWRQVLNASVPSSYSSGVPDILAPTPTPNKRSRLDRVLASESAPSILQAANRFVKLAAGALRGRTQE